MRRRVEVLEHTIRTKTNVRLAFVPDDLDLVRGRAHQLHAIAELDRTDLDARRVTLEAGHLDAVVTAGPTVAAVGADGLRGPRTSKPPAAPRPAVFGSPAKRYRLSGTFSVQRATTTTMRTTFFKYAFVTAATSATVVLFAGGIASAHIEPDPIAMQAGTSATVAFNVEHGCDGSPTTSMTFQIPEGVTDAVAVEKEGWTATLTGDTLEFVGGPLDPEQADHFDITFTAPAAAGDIHFPVVQACEAGELAWIEIPEEGAEEPERPAPTIKITEGAPTAEDLAPEHEEEEATEETLVTQSTDGAAAPTATVAPADDDDDDSNTGTIVIVVIGAAIVLVGGGVMLARRNKATPQP